MGWWTKVENVVEIVKKNKKKLIVIKGGAKWRFTNLDEYFNLNSCGRWET